MSEPVDFGGPSSSQGLRLGAQDESEAPPLKLLRRTVGVARAGPGGEATSEETASSLRPRQYKRPKTRSKQRQRHKNPRPATAAAVSPPSHPPPLPATAPPNSHPPTLLLASRPQPLPLPVHPTATVPVIFPSQAALTPQTRPSPIVINLCTPSPSPPERNSLEATTAPATSSSTQGFAAYNTLNRGTTGTAVSQPEVSVSSNDSSQFRYPSHDPAEQGQPGSLDAMVPRTVVSAPREAPPRPTHTYSLRQRSGTQRGSSSAAMATGFRGNGQPYGPDSNPSQSGLRLSHYGNPLAALGTWNPVPMRRTFHSVPASSSPPPPYITSSSPGIDHSLIPGSTADRSASSSMQLQSSASSSSIPAPYRFSLSPSPATGASNVPTPATNILPPSPSPSDPSIAPFLPTLTSAPALIIGSPIPSRSHPGSPYATGFPASRTGQSSQSSPARANPLRPPLALSLSPTSPGLAVPDPALRPPASSHQETESLARRNYWSDMATRLDRNTAFIAAHSHDSGGSIRNRTSSSASRQPQPGPIPRVPDPGAVAQSRDAQMVPRAIPAASDGIGGHWSEQALGLGQVGSSRSVVSATNSRDALVTVSDIMVPGADLSPDDAGSSRLPSHAPSYPVFGPPGLDSNMSHSTSATEGPSYSSPSSLRYHRLPSSSLANNSYEGAGTSSSRGGSSGPSSRRSRDVAGSSARGSQQERGPSTSVASSGRGRQRESEVIIVDDIDSDSDDDVIIGSVEMGDEHRRRQLQISRDLAYARALQAQLNRETTIAAQPPPPTSLASHPLSAHTAIPRGSVPSHPLPTAAIPSRPDPATSPFPSPFPWVPIEEDSFPFDELELLPTPPPSARRDSRRSAGPVHVPMPRPPPAPEGEGHVYPNSSIIRDNFDALASRVNSWTAADARRILHVARLATPTNRRRPRSRRNLMGAVMELPPAIIYRAIMLGSPLRDGGSYEELLEIAERLGPARVQGLSKEVIDSLPVKDYSTSVGGETESCVVCMSEFEERDKVRSLPCTHDFHQKCIDHWLKDHRTCPICRVEVRSSQ